MAQLYATGGWVAPGSVAAYLREALPDNHIVVANPVVCRCPIDAIVVGPGGLSIVQTPEGDGLSPDELRRRGRTPQECERNATQAVKTFLADEHPRLAPVVRYYRAERDAGGEPVWRTVEGGGAMAGKALAESIESAGQGGVPLWAAPETQEDLAAELREDRLTATMRASNPFVFRSGGPFRVGATVWTIKDAVAHMDRYPEDGVYHLRNGTLAAWLKEEGAGRLAELAREAPLSTKSDGRAALELFLIGTGLVERPVLVCRPRAVDLGYALQGEAAQRVLRLKRRRGRGYLYGELATNEPWLSLEPLAFAGDATEVVVTAATDALPIHPQPHLADVLVDSTAAEAPVAIPARVRVVAAPPPLVRYGVRPLIAALLGLLLGAGIGVLFGLTGAPLPAAIEAVRPLGVSIWVFLVAALWALFGLVRGLTQPPAWPALYAAGRWLPRLAAWAGALALGAVLIVWAWRLGAGDAPMAHSDTYFLAALGGLALAVIPASLSEAASGGRAADPTVVKGRWNRRRAIAVAALAAVVLAAALLIPRAVAPAWRQLQAQGALQDATAWVENSWSRLEGLANGAIDVLYLRYYDRRAPLSPTPTPTPPESAATPLGAAPVTAQP
jgi:hypothetical protein